MFSKILIANRGEIAVRIIRACDELGVASVAVYSELDRDAPHVARAGEAYLLGGAAPAESYLNVERILEVVRESGAEAVHPGLRLPRRERGVRARLRGGGGRLHRPARRRDRRDGLQDAGARAHAGRRACRSCREPSSRCRTLADARARSSTTRSATRSRSRRRAAAAARAFASRSSEDELEAAFEGAAREGEKFFSDATVYLERYLPDPRHVEVQVLADAHGTTIHLGERDCSIQRRHQKLVEESPAPEWIVDEALRERIGKIAVEAARAVDYRGAGTVEGLLDGASTSEYFFLEMNTRVQVEHCVTEMTTGVDIVKEGIRVAAGEPLSLAQDDVVLRGHAIECRINAEDASKKFAPGAGDDRRLRRAVGAGRARRLGRARRQRRLADVRPDGRQAHRLGRRPRAGDGAHAARARRSSRSRA